MKILTLLFCFALVSAATAEAKTGLAYQRYSRGVELAAKKNYAEAVVQFRQAIDLNPSYIASYIECARSMVMLGKRNEGMKELASAVALTKRKEDLDRLAKERATLSEIFYTNATFQNYQNGLNYLRLDHSNSATEAFERAYSVEPDNVLVLLGYSQALDAEDNQKLRQELLEKAFILNPGNADVRLSLAGSLLAKEPVRALQVLRPLALDKQANEDVVILYSRTLVSLKRNKDAIDFLRDRSEKNPDWMFAQFWLGKFYAQETGGAWMARKSLMTFLKRTEPLMRSANLDTSVEQPSGLRSKNLKATKTEADLLLTQVNKALE